MYVLSNSESLCAITATANRVLQDQAPDVAVNSITFANCSMMQCLQNHAAWVAHSVILPDDTTPSVRRHMALVVLTPYIYHNHGVGCEGYTDNKTSEGFGVDNSTLCDCNTTMLLEVVFMFHCPSLTWSLVIPGDSICG